MQQGRRPEEVALSDQDRTECLSIYRQEFPVAAGQALRMMVSVTHCDWHSVMDHCCAARWCPVCCVFQSYTACADCQSEWFHWLHLRSRARVHSNTMSQSVLLPMQTHPSVLVAGFLLVTVMTTGGMPVGTMVVTRTPSSYGSTYALLQTQRLAAIQAINGRTGVAA